MSDPVLVPEQVEELHQDLLAAHQRLEENLRLPKDGAKPVELATPIGRLSRVDAIQQHDQGEPLDS